MPQEHNSQHGIEGEGVFSRLPQEHNSQHSLGDEDGVFSRLSKEQFEDSNDDYARFRRDRTRRDISFDEWNPPRERQPGKKNILFFN